jgi:hypothetical protein
VQSFQAWARRRRVGFGLWSRPTCRPDRHARCAELTLRALQLHNEEGRSALFEGADVDSLLRSALVAGHDYLLVQSAGSWIRDREALRAALEAEMERGFLVLGHVLDRGEAYYSLHHQCFMVDLERWADLGCPRFGDPGQTPRTLHRPRRSEEAFHHGYTPLWIAPSGERQGYARQEWGWHLIHAGLEAGQRIAPFSRAVRRAKGYLYPGNAEGFDARLAAVRAEASGWGAWTWVANTEETPDVAAFTGPVKTLVSVAAGLAPWALLAQAGFTAGTVVHFVDASADTLAFQRWLLERWDGEGYADAVAAFHRDHPAAGAQPDATPAALTALERQADLRAAWPGLRRLAVHSHRIDLLSADCGRVRAWLGPATMVSFSNVFHSRRTHLGLTESENAEAWQRWLETIEGAWGLGVDPWNRTVAGFISTAAGSPAAVNRCFPPDVLSFFAGEQHWLREANRR